MKYTLNIDKTGLFRRNLSQKCLIINEHIVNMRKYGKLTYHNLLFMLFYR